MSKRRAITEKPALDLIEDTVALLRSCPPGVMVLYYIGTLPFVLGLLFFWTDMSRGAYAREHLTEASLTVALEYLWCKCWQSLFAVHLLAVASRRPLPRWTWGRLVRLCAGQGTIQGTGLFVLPVAALITVPMAYAYAFYQNVTALALDAQGEPLDGTALRREALAQARRWPMQNHVGLAVLSLFWLAVFLNLLILILALPWLLKMLLGIETMETRSGWSAFNSTLFGAAAGLSYLCVDPVIKAFYTLRCFHGRSLASGEDLRVALRAAAAPVITALAAMVLLCCGTVAHGASPGDDTGRAAQLDRAIGNVLERPEFAWRSPREETADAKAGPVDNFMRGVLKMVGRWMRPVRHWLRGIFKWIGDKLSHQGTVELPAGSGPDWAASLRVFAWIFTAFVICALAVIAWKIYLRRTVQPTPIAEPRRILPDLTAEDVAADQLPEDAWLGLAREMIERGELRLALRALYLAALAHLGERQFISIARYKSNREYERELRRRRPAETELNATFADTVGMFERAWYGMHEVTADILDASQVNLERIRQC
jgi:hypothetical protein